MTEQTRSALRELQQLDLQIRKKRDEAEAYEPRILEVEEPAIELEGQVERTRGRIQEMRVEERRLELATKEKRARREKLQERLNQVRNVREESAVNAELEMVERALETEESEALSLLDQIRRLELELEEQNDLWEKAKSEVGPRREALVAERDAIVAELDGLEASRAEAAEGVDPAELKMYDAIRGDGRRTALAALTVDGACGNCFSVIPLQLQQEIMRGSGLIRCEACGVILAAPEPEPEEPEESEGPEAADDAPDEVATGSETADDEETPEA
jgi:predicted  nucleic acid-binding Zn-ribbon protein